ncbi:MAG: hypothetical protein ACM3YF_02080 [Candidatus Zixiibacteriota bacterium]
MSVEDDEKLIEEVWGSTENLYEFFRSEIQRLGPIICGQNVVLPQVQLEISDGDPLDIMFGRGQSKSGRYDFDPLYLPGGLVKVYPTAYASRDSVTIAIAHELIHHWERLKKRQLQRQGFRYPKGADRLIENIFRDSTRERRWRGSHSNNFIAKAARVSTIFNVPFREMLVHVIKRKFTEETQVSAPASELSNRQTA